MSVTERPRALVTAPFRGEGMETLRSLADVVYDPWIEQVPLRLYNGEKLAARIEAEGANLLIVESDSVKGPVLDLPLLCIGSCRGDPNNVDIAAATAARIPVLRAPGRNAERRRGDHARASMFAVNRWLVPADHDVRTGEVYAEGKIPYQRYRAWELSGRTVGIVGLGAVGRAAKWRFEGHRHARPLVRPVQPRRDSPRRPRSDARRVRRRLGPRGRDARRPRTSSAQRSSRP